MTEIRPATVEDFVRLGSRVPKTARAFAAADGGDVLGIGGVYRDGTSLVLFGELTDKIRSDKRAFVRLIRAVKTLLDGRAAYSLADPEIDGSDVLLRHIGFEPFEGRVYRWQPL